jgi:hypothetical protein
VQERQILIVEEHCQYSGAPFKQRKEQLAGKNDQMNKGETNNYCDPAAYIRAPDQFRIQTYLAI